MEKRTGRRLLPAQPCLLRASLLPDPGPVTARGKWGDRAILGRAACLGTLRMDDNGLMTGAPSSVHATLRSPARRLVPACALLRPPPACSPDSDLGQVAGGVAAMVA